MKSSKLKQKMQLVLRGEKKNEKVVGEPLPQGTNTQLLGSEVQGPVNTLPVYWLQRAPPMMECMHLSRDNLIRPAVSSTAMRSAAREWFTSPSEREPMALR